jgi:MFS family permease
MIVLNFLYATSAYPAGIAADHLNRRILFFMGLVMLVFADLVLALAAAPWQVFLGTGLWGLHMGLTQGLFKLVADSSPADLRGSAFGIFIPVSGLALSTRQRGCRLSVGTHWPICYFHHWRDRDISI